MKKLILLSITATLLFALISCTQSPSGDAGSPPPVPPVTDTPGEESAAPSPDVTPLVSGTPAAPSEPPAKEWQDVFVSFLSENYDRLSEMCFGGIAGAGFIDLDVDGTAELLLFDAGASASMGVQFFDIAPDGKVYCVSANISELGNAFGDRYFSDVYVNAGFFDDFRLMEDKQNGERFFFVESGNASEDFLYRELIRFELSEDMLSPASLLYKSETYALDEKSDTMVTVASSFERAGADISADEYNAELDTFFSSCAEVDYTPAGMFIWEDKNYDGSMESFMRLVQSAIKRYQPLP